MIDLETVIHLWIRDHPILSRCVTIGQNCLIINNSYDIVSRVGTLFDIAIYIEHDKVRTSFNFVKFNNSSEYISASDPKFFDILEDHLIKWAKTMVGNKLAWN